jgi:hypothetical protein
VTPAVEELVRETIELTGAAGPELMEADAPVLGEGALGGGGGGAETGFYLIGIIGGKDVGKSALVNALVGRSITATTSHGPGTETAVAYAHRSQEPALRALLEREVPGRFRVVTHEEPHLRTQVLLDLPDIDSHFASHPEVTRAMLRHMLFPVWVQSVEKYADRQPQEMLRRVAQGNAASNFVFCLNKVDQVEGAEARRQEGPVSPAAREIGEDFGRRIGKTLGLDAQPRVFMISAIRPDRYDLPELRGLLSRQKSDDVVRQSKALAVRRQDQSLLAWVDQQRLGERAERLGRLQRDGQELLAARVGEPLLESAIPRLIDDPGNRLAMADEILRRRVARWPLVNLVHTLLSPLLMVWRSNVGPAGRGGLRGADALVDSYLEGDGEPLSSRVQTTFAQLRRANPLVAELYRENHLWESMPAESAAFELRRALAVTVDRQRAAATETLAGKGGVIAPLFRWLLTIGALLWFPLVQPILSGFLNSSEPTINWYPDPRRLVGLLVSVLSGEMLLKNATFLILWFTVIWLALRWRTQRKLGRLLTRWRSAEHPDPSLNLSTQALQWMRDLLAPIDRSTERVRSLAQRADAMRDRSNAA